MKYLAKIKEHFPFEKPRPNQFEYINYILERFIDKDEDYFLLESPTGTGKSVLGFTIGKYIELEVRKQNNINTIKQTGDEITGPPVIILTSTHVLQKQYSDTFKDFGVEYIWAASNYECQIFPPEANVYYNAPGCLKTICPQYGNCEYIKQRNKFKSAKIGITNYHYFIANLKMNTNLLICDEAHNIPSILFNSAEIKFSHKSFAYFFSICEKMEEIKFKLNKTEIINNFNILMQYDFEEIELNSFYTFATMFRETLAFNEILLNEFVDEFYNEVMSLFKDKMQDITEEYKNQILKLARIQNYFQNTVEKLDNYLENKGDWVVSNFTRQPDDSYLTMKPLMIHDQFNNITKKTNKLLMMSATICGGEEFKKEIGLTDHCTYLETPSIFPVQNRRIFSWNAGGLNFKNRDKLLPVFSKIVDDIIYKVTNNFTQPQNGIIHSVSYANAEYLKSNSRYKSKMFIPNKSELLELNSILEKNKKQGIIILSPSIIEGVDLIDDLSRFQIFIKVPFASLGDRWVKRKLNDDQKWYARNTIIKIVQGTGRSIRSETDWAYTFVLDSNFNKLIADNVELVPKWFLESIQYNN